MEFFGILIHDPDVAFTDLGLAALGAWFAWRLGRTPGAAFMAGLASAAFWGAIFHGFFPAGIATRGGFVIWMAVAFSILVTAATLIALSLEILAPRLPRALRGSVVIVYAAVFALVVLLCDQSFGTILRFYGPALALFLVVAVSRAASTRDTGWILMVVGLLIAAGAALMQQMGVALHPVYFDHNALYHVVQGVALALLAQGFRRAPGLAPAPVGPSRADGTGAGRG